MVVFILVISHWNVLFNGVQPVLRQQVLSEGELVSVQSRFNYAWGLIKSNKVDDQRLGVKILTDVFKDSPQRRRECLYYLSIGTYKLGDYADARRYSDALVQHEPDNQQAQALQKMIEDQISKDGLIGIALISGVVAAGATALSLFLRKKR
ncbi:Mitochondria fission 1 protein [Wickerhamomyces ciferrii]|uniref:Mitochondrial fission 1 protein n=1 Tax=Wickerhamomyces ciferrii (strain ATCC 14091 / BCRC 22168 / CBS 111 / JCM 3599 / NBRC 0793 / NRRL Y-1031 F-60-10) TaxID=1206466 RepID=K0KSM3_WICCF|nr:Mitochondria fission 1 protein [Wickerhamomyces ciferrii]CCH44349.1 Mitochondria fission 1 protein [Wickerhamomyces ciferrii]